MKRKRNQSRKGKRRKIKKNENMMKLNDGLGKSHKNKILQLS